MFIEVLKQAGGRCGAKCFTCPDTISGPQSGPYSDLMFETFNKIMCKFGKEEISFSFQNDLSELLAILQNFPFEFREHNLNIGCSINFPFDAKILEGGFREFASAIPNARLDLFLENRGALSNYKNELFALIEIFLTSEIKNLSFAWHNNSMKVDTFNQKVDTLSTSTNALFREILKTYQPDSFKKFSREESVSFDPIKRRESFEANLDLKISSKNLVLSERILSFEEGSAGSGDLINFYRTYFTGELDQDGFDVESISLALTQIGVRVNHRSIDIRNPYLWLSYDEFFRSLDQAESLNDLCLGLQFLMQKTGFITDRITEINYKTIDALGKVRMALG